MAGSATVQSVLRGLDILEAVAQSPHGLALAELALAVDLKPTTVHNLARSLIARRYLAQLRHPTRYVLGPAISELAAPQRRRDFQRQADAAVRALARQVPAGTITLSEMIGGEVFVTHRIAPERPAVIERPQRMTLPPYTSATALLFDALADADQRTALRQRYPFDEYGIGFWRDLDRLESFLDQVRRLGYALPPSGTPRRFRAAAPVFSPTHELLAVLGVALPAGAGPDADAPALAALLHMARKLGMEPRNPLAKEFP